MFLFFMFIQYKLDCIATEQHSLNPIFIREVLNLKVILKLRYAFEMRILAIEH